jgi:hypothetical protein
MPIALDVDEERNVLVSRATGELGVDELIAYMAELKRETRLRPGYRSYVDFSAADPSRIDAAAIRRVVDVASGFDPALGPVRVAVFAPSDLAFGLARIYAALVESLQREVRVFRDAADARAWLCLAGPGGDLAA